LRNGLSERRGAKGVDASVVELEQVENMGSNGKQLTVVLPEGRFEIHEVSGELFLKVVSVWLYG